MKLAEAPRVVWEAGVAVTEQDKRPLHTLWLAALSLFAASSDAAVAPEDRADAMYHSYNGGGIEITGPSLLVRKQLNKTVSVSGKYYVDSISGASIDVVTTASPYQEKRTEMGGTVDMVEDDVSLTAGYSNSDENDYTANTAFVSFSQEMFGNMTTLAMGYSRGWDEVRKRNDTTFLRETDRHNYRLSLAQVLTKDALASINIETVTDQGYLNNPYRSVRYLSGNTYLRQAEIYPRTRTSTAVSINVMYYLAFEASLSSTYRATQDSWGIYGHTFELGYLQRWQQAWTVGGRVRMYQQNHADFYSDLYDYESAQNYLGRDKELSTFNNVGVGTSVSYEFPAAGLKWAKKSSVNMVYDHIRFQYDDFRDLRVNTTPGTEPLYAFSANVLQLFISVWY